ncbi:histone-lysine N-methyltransferase SETMAR [Trichonephila clavata]|uniref:Histone-lysine N-methyltransferase SETMAR n=1 Tax=Trichonephila clavata TaxID=2740835 RepID=A0A8X6G5Q5_TRICU|nr:histone-lysine N-methyltransferase SETMAR [Trichonephila clavata]
MEVKKEKIRYILQFFFDKGKRTRQLAEIANGADRTKIIPANYAQFWLSRIRLGLPVVENINAITKMIGVNWRVSNHGISQNIKFDHKKF